MRILGQILLAVGIVVVIASIVFGRYHGVLIGVIIIARAVYAFQFPSKKDPKSSKRRIGRVRD
jgi:hypothetical protein